MSHDVLELRPEAQVAPAAPQETATILSVIERAALDPRVDIDRLERLMQMHERSMERQAKAAYAAALAAMQPDLPVIAERGAIKNNAGKVQSTYALWADLNEAIKPVLARHGFALSFRTGQRDGKIVVTGILSHRDGHSEETTIDLPVDGSGSKNAVQAIGSSTSYGQRYTARALLNLTSRLAEDADDDGRAAGAGSVITDEQAGRIRELATVVKADVNKLLNYFRAESISDIAARDYERVIGMLEAKRQKEAAHADR